MQASFDAAMAQKQALEDDATALAGEEGRWTQQSKEFDDTIQKLTGERQPLVLLRFISCTSSSCLRISHDFTGVVDCSSVLCPECPCTLSCTVLRHMSHVGSPMLEQLSVAFMLPLVIGHAMWC